MLGITTKNRVETSVNRRSRDSSDNFPKSMTANINPVRLAPTEQLLEAVLGAPPYLSSSREGLRGKAGSRPGVHLDASRGSILSNGSAAGTVRWYPH